MKLGIVISTDDAETVWNAFRLANFSIKEKDDVKIFLVGKAVGYEKNSSQKFDSVGQARAFVDAGGSIQACGTCMKSRHQESTNTCPTSSLKDLYKIAKESDKVVCF
ncbi:MAG: DsrE family protein [Candidatus Micrarchaeota archaeon]